MKKPKYKPKAAKTPADSKPLYPPEFTGQNPAPEKSGERQRQTSLPSIVCLSDNKEMALFAKPGFSDFDVCALISKWSLQVEAGEKSEFQWAFSYIAKVAHKVFQELVRLAFGGHENSAKELHRILAANVSEFDELCRQNPSLFEPIARKTTCWPAFMSRLTDTKKRNEQLAELLNLGRDSGLNISGKQPSIETPEVKIAYSLHGIMEVYRQGWLDQPAHAKRMRAEWRRINKSLGRPANYRPPAPKRIPTKPEWEEEFRLRAESQELARNLTPLNRQNYPEWFEASWPFFLSRWGKDFENRKCLAHHWKSDAFMEDVPGNPGKKRLRARARGDIRDAIRKKIKQAFRSIAPKSLAVG